MALSAATVWEVRSATGSDTNGGGFVAGATGTDYSQQASPQYSVTDGVTAGTTTITSATASFGTDVVGNILYISGGTGSITAGWYQIVSRTNATTIVVDRSTGLSAGTGATIHIGGALATLNATTTIAVASNVIFATGSETRTANITYPVGLDNMRIVGYGSSRGDGGRYTITLSTNTGLTALIAPYGLAIENLLIDCSNLGTSKGILTGQDTLSVYNCKIINYTSYGVSSGGTNVTIFGCEFTGGGSSSIALYASNNNIGWSVVYNHIHDNSGYAISLAGSTARANVVVLNNIIVNNAGTSGAAVTICCGVCMYNVIHNSGQDGILVTNTFSSVGASAYGIIRGNIISNNARYGINGSSKAQLQKDGNAFYANTSGDRHGIDLTAGQNLPAPYTNIYDVILTGDPFNNASTDPTVADWGLNSTAGAGLDCQGTFGPSAFPGNTLTATYPDFGAVQKKPILPSDLAPVGDVIAGVDRGDGQTGTYKEVAETDVRLSVTYGADLGAGVYQYTGEVNVPADYQVVYGVAVDVSDTGTVVLPDAGDVRRFVFYGPNGATDGNFYVPSIAVVKLGSTYGSADTEFTGTYAASGSGSTQIIGG